MEQLVSYASVTEAGMVGPTTAIVLYAIHGHVAAGGDPGNTNMLLGSDAGTAIFRLAGAAGSTVTHEFPYGVVIDGGLYAEMGPEFDLITIVYQKI